jgi:hypothetical protein
MERSSNPMLAHQVQFSGREQALQSFFLSELAFGARRGGVPGGLGLGFDGGKQRDLVRVPTM